MAIINLPEPRAKKYSTVVDLDKTYYFVQVIHAFEVSRVLDTVPEEILEFIRHGNIYLIISNEFECFDDVIEEIYNSIIITSKVPENKILFLSGAEDIKQLSDNITKNFNKIYNTNFLGLNVKFFNGGEISIGSQIGKNKTNLKRTLSLNGKIDYKKHYILLNNRWRPHRPTLVAILSCKDLLSKGYVSLGDNDANYSWSNIYNQLVSLNKNSDFISTLLQKHEIQIKSLGKFELDAHKFEHKKPMLSPTLSQYYEQSFMSIVTETYFYNHNTMFISEKTYKPIAYKQPFIIVGVKGTLQFLKRLGYKTFHPYIDESYDNEEDSAIRMEKIVLEIERISMLDNDSLRKLSTEIRDICIHNYNVLLSKVQ